MSILVELEGHTLVSWFGDDDPYDVSINNVEHRFG